MVAPERRPYRVVFYSGFQKAISRIPADDAQRISTAVNELATDPRPRGCKKLVGLEGLWRIRVGDYRIMYKVQDQELLVMVLKVGHRRNVYE